MFLTLNNDACDLIVLNLYVKQQPSSDKEAEACTVYVAVKFTTK